MTKPKTDLDEAVAEEINKYQAILVLLASGEELSTYQIARRLDINGTGQTLNRLRVLERRGRVERIPGEKPGWKVWRISMT